ncbi:ATP-binding cassette domain-containing protein [Actinomycetes bacterium KLBMP 9797]
MTDLVDVAGLCLHAAGMSIVDHVSFTVAKGESVALTGPSGSGKTSTALALLGHLRDGVEHLGGIVTVAGLPALPAPHPALRGHTAAYLGQDPGLALNPYRRIRTTLLTALGRTPRHRRRAAVEDLLTRVALRPDLAERYPHQLSGGQQQRAALATALARQPRLLILDEPTSALDSDTAADIRTELTRVREQGVSLLWITHDLPTVIGAVDRVLALDAGRLVEHTPAALAAPTMPAPAARSGPPVLAVYDVGARFPGGPTLFEPVSFQVRPGSGLAVLGRSGTGKTTLARCLAGLHQPTTGSIQLDGHRLPADIRRRSRAQRAAVQLVAQDPAGALHPRQDVRTALARPLRLLRGLPTGADLDREVTRLLNAVHLPASFAGRLPAELSGGQRQRVALARALAASPRVLVCDEITSALDPATRDAILDLLDELRTRGLALVIVTHDPHVAQRLAHDTLVLRRSEVVGDHEGHHGTGIDLHHARQSGPGQSSVA